MSVRRIVRPVVALLEKMEPFGPDSSCVEANRADLVDAGAISGAGFGGGGAP